MKPGYALSSNPNAQAFKSVPDGGKTAGHGCEAIVLGVNKETNK
jgi:hypothetical protein